MVFLILFIAIETLIFIKLVKHSASFSCCVDFPVYYSLFVAVIVDNLARAQSSSDVTEYGDKMKTKVKVSIVSNTAVETVVEVLGHDSLVSTVVLL